MASRWRAGAWGLDIRFVLHLHSKKTHAAPTVEAAWFIA
jgi:hypothetical protein